LSIEVIADHNNPLLKRREIKLIVHHEGSGTPDRMAVRKIGSDQFKAPLERVVVRDVQTRTGGSSARVLVEIYEDSQPAKRIVPAYLKNRNLPPGQRTSRKKGEEDKAAPVAPKPEASEKKAEQPKPAAAKEQKPATTETKPPAKPESKSPPKAPAKQDTKAKP